MRDLIKFIDLTREFLNDNTFIMSKKSKRDVLLDIVNHEYDKWANEEE